MRLVQKCQVFVYLDLVKIKNRIFQSLNNRTFPKGITHAFGQKCQFFGYLDLAKM